MHDLSRRDLIHAGLHMTALGLPGLATTRAQTMPLSARDLGYYSYTVGDIRCTALYDGIWRKQHADDFILNASVDETRAALVEGGLDAAYVTIEFTQTLLQTCGRTVLIDPGTGGQWVPTAGAMADNLARAGFGTGDIDTVLISHFHPDHIFGLMEEGSDAQVFPEAEIVVPAAEYGFWTDPGVFTRLPRAWHPLAARIQKTFPFWPNLRQADPDTEVAPQIRGFATPGHTPGHMAFHVASGREQLIVAGDVAITPALFVANPGWHVTFDADPGQAERTRRRLFDRVAADDIAVAGYHFGFPNAGCIHRNGAGYAFEPLRA